MKLTRRALLAGVAGTAALAALPTAPATAAVTNTILPSPVPQGGIGGETEIHCSSPVILSGVGLCLAIGGSFSSLRLPNGSTVTAQNAAIVRVSDHKVIWAGKGIDSYVSHVAAYRGVIYWGGKFRTFQGQARDRLAAVNTSGALLPWNPRLGVPCTALAFAGDRIFVGGTHAWAVDDARNGKTGATRWKLTTETGPVRSMLVLGGYLYVGGMFEKIGGRAERLVKVSPAGVIDRTFNPPFRNDTWNGGPADGYAGDCILSLAAYPGGGLLVGDGGRRNGMFVLNPTTGRVKADSRWTYTYRSRNGVYSPPPFEAYMQRNSEGDVQAVAVVGQSILTGNHRGHINSNTDWPTKRMLTSWSTATGRVATGFDPGFWGGNTNISKVNGGVQTLTYLPTAKVLVVGGCFKGYGDPYNNTGGGDIYGAPGTRQAALAYIRTT